MGLFKKKKLPEIPTKTACELFGHMWQDFPWVIESEYNKNANYSSKIEIVEYYCCRICHCKKSVVLFKTYDRISRNDHELKIKELEQKYHNQIKPIPIVQDMINDMIHVDRERLKIWEDLHKGD